MTRALVLSLGTDETNNYNNKHLLRALRERGVDCALYDVLKIFPESLYKDGVFSEDDRNLVYDDGSALAAPDLIIMSNSIPIVQPSAGNRLSQVTSILKAWSDTGVVFMNDVDAHVAASTKHTSYSILKAAGIPMPNAEIIPVYSESEEELITVKADIIQAIGFPLVVKPVFGYNGDGVYKCDDEAAFNAAIESIRSTSVDSIVSNPKIIAYNLEKLALEEREEQLTEQEALGIVHERLAKKARNIPIVVQEYESRGAGLMVSIRVVGDQLLGCYCIGSPYHMEDFKSELAAGRMQIACNIDPALDKICKDTQRALNLDVFRVDLFVVDDGYRVCEINCPGAFNRLDMACNVDQASMVVDYALSKLGRV